MTTDIKLKSLIVIGILTAAIGFILLFFSVHFGTSLAENWLIEQGGADTSIYLIVIEGYMNNFLAAGSILLGVGLFTLILTYYKMNTMKD